MMVAFGFFKLFALFFALFFPQIVQVYCQSEEDEYSDFDLAQSYRFCKDPSDPMVWVYRPLPKDPYRHFTSIKIILNLSDTQARVLQSQNRTELVENLRQHNSLFGFISRISTWHSASVNPFKTAYLGVVTDQAYRIKYSVTNVDLLRVLALLAGVVLYLTARKIVRQTVFYYSSGTVLGVVASLLIIVFIMSKYVPARSAAVSVLVGGWSFSLYLLYSFYRNITTVLLAYQKWVAAYLVTAAVISFALSYRFGVPKDPRSVNLYQWGLQLLALGIVYWAGQVVEASFVIILLLCTYSMTPTAFFAWFYDTWRYRFPRPRKLLTEDEFANEGRKETARALAELRGYCKSPKCDSWKTVSKLNSPTRDRFIEFMAGNNSHLSDEELLDYDSFNAEESILTDDESDSNDEQGNRYTSFGNSSRNVSHHRTFNGSVGHNANRSARSMNMNNTVHDLRNRNGHLSTSRYS